ELRKVKAELATALHAGGADPDAVLALTDAKEALQRRLAAAVSAEAAAVDALTPHDLCTSLPPRTAVLELVQRGVGFNEAATETGLTYDAYLLTPACELVLTPLGDAGSIDDQIERYRELLASRAPTSRVDRQGKKVRKAVFDPLEDALADADTVQVVPDGAFASLAFATLPTSGGHLLDRYAFRTLDAAVDAVPREAPVPVGPAVVVGGVDYGSAGEPGTSRASCAAGFPPLPGTSAEADAVGAMLAPLGDVRRLGGQAADETGVVEALEGARMLHLATHGFFATGACRSALDGTGEAGGLNPMLLSGLALAGANTDPAAIWTAEEIATLPLQDVDLVVLSACESGLGEVAVGEGVLGLQRAFALSGARATITSLWPVDDTATRDLMTRFYTALLADPARDEAAALRKAQRGLRDANLATTGEARPETWGAFVVSGQARR
ncbi:MAG: CHAT domain-containing protein, partial [Myxococcales bacterium]|nr:CHAT domain-containing protein [Myxococcales bacterium]